jgi:hypothetical protein
MQNKEITEEQLFDYFSNHSNWEIINNLWFLFNGETTVDKLKQSIINYYNSQEEQPPLFTFWVDVKRTSKTRFIVEAENEDKARCEAETIADGIEFFNDSFEFNVQPYK